MPIEMPRGLPFSVDTWTPKSKLKRQRFLTHAHKDHTAGILTHSSYPIYCTRLTKSLLHIYCPQIEDSLFVFIEVGETVVVDDPDGEFKVTAFDANHCPGAVMFLFEGNFGNILHTGDCRLIPECLQCLPEKYVGKKGKTPTCQLDYVFLDCTFGNFQQGFPSKQSATQQVIRCIWKHPSATVVYLTCDLLGQEDILVDVSRSFGSKIFVDKVANPESFHALTLTVPEIITQDPSSRFHLFDGFPKLYERAAGKIAEAQAEFRPEPLIIRPSVQWYACEDELADSQVQRKLKFHETLRDPCGVWHVCYSLHSSRKELEWALQLLAPKWVVSTTPNFRAMDLHYVKKHCIGQLTANTSLWKLLDISTETYSEISISMSAVCHSSVVVVEGSTKIYAESQSQPEKVTSGKLLSLSPPSKRPAVTLFGRARFGMVEDDLSTVGEIKSHTMDHGVPFKVDGTVSECRNKVEDKLDDSNATEGQCDNSPKKVLSRYPIGSSKCFSESMRKLYRSMNVPVPRPLPSLVELMDANKRARRRFGI